MRPNGYIHTWNNKSPYCITLSLFKHDNDQSCHTDFQILHTYVEGNIAILTSPCYIGWYNAQFDHDFSIHQFIKGISLKWRQVNIVQDSCGFNSNSPLNRIGMWSGYQRNTQGTYIYFPIESYQIIKARHNMYLIEINRFKYMYT